MNEEVLTVSTTYKTRSVADLARHDLLLPNTLLVVTGRTGSGMTDFALRLLQEFDGNVVLTESLKPSPDNFFTVNTLSGLLKVIDGLSGRPLAVFIDHYAFVGDGTFGHPKGYDARLVDDAMLTLFDACRRARAVLVITGSGLRDFPLDSREGSISGWDYVVKVTKNTLTTAGICSIFGPLNMTVSRWPRTRLQHDTQEFSRVELST